MIDQLEQLWFRLRSVVMGARVSYVDDSGPVQLAQARVSANMTRDQLPRLAEYGFQSVPPVGADVVMLHLAGEQTTGVIIATGHQTYRLRGLSSGEVAISDDKGQKVYLSAAGIRIEGGSLPVQINASAGLTINANTTINGTVTANGHRIDETHKHTGVTAGGALSGVVS